MRVFNMNREWDYHGFLWHCSFHELCMWHSLWVGIHMKQVGRETCLHWLGTWPTSWSIIPIAQCCMQYNCSPRPQNHRNWCQLWNWRYKLCMSGPSFRQVFPYGLVHNSHQTRQGVSSFNISLQQDIFSWLAWILQWSFDTSPLGRKAEAVADAHTTWDAACVLHGWQCPIWTPHLKPRWNPGHTSVKTWYVFQIFCLFCMLGGDPSQCFIWWFP